MPTESSVHYELIFSADGLEPRLMRPTRVRASEGVSTPYVVDVDIRGDHAELDPETLLWKSALVTVLRSDDGSVVRTFCGVITRASENVRPRSQAQHVPSPFAQVLGIRIESPLAALRWSSDFRVWRELPAHAIIKKLVEAAGIEARFALTGTYPVRRTCTHFGESTLDFVSRLLEEEGIFHFAVHKEDKVEVVFADNASAYVDLDPVVIPLREGTGLASEEAILELAPEWSLAPTTVKLRDRDPKKPSLDLTAEAKRAGTPIEHYAHPGGYQVIGEGKRRAANLLQAFTAASEGFRGRSSSFALTPGHVLDVTADDEALAGRFVVDRVEHAWDDTVPDGEVRYESRFRVVRDSVALLPTPKTPRAVVTPQLATIVGPSGADIHADEQGDVRVKFPWDRAEDDQGSYGIARLMQLPLSNAYALPRLGWEVLVDFEYGDADRPIVLGRMVNATYPPPWALPKSSTVSSFGTYVSPGRDGENVIRIDDAQGAEKLYVHAQKDFDLVTVEDRNEQVTTNESVGIAGVQVVEVDGDQQIDINADHELRIGGNQTWTVKAKRTETIKGEHTVDIGKNRTLSITASHERDTDESDALSIGGTWTETIGATLTQKVEKDMVFLVGADASITVGGLMKDEAGKGRSDLVLGKRTTTIGAASMIKSGADLTIGVGGDRTMMVGAALMANAGGKLELSSEGELKITVAGALAFTGASAVVFKVGDSTVTLSGGAVVIASKKVKITASGPAAQLAAVVSDN